MFETLNLIYDGYCDFCFRVLKIFRWLDISGTLRLIDAHEHERVEATFPMLNEADTHNAMFAVTQDGQVYRGFFAFRHLVWQSPFTWPLILLFYFPGANFFGPRIYAWVARNRRDFGCESNVCALPDRSLPR
jgi:predicted DCC family thiol-disulfide oxidoreductase YuxK